MAGQEPDDLYPGHTLGALRFRSTPTGLHLLVYKAVSLGGIYDTWAPGGGDVRRVSHPTLRPSTILAYLVSSPFGGEGWFVRVDNLEDVIGGHVYVGII